MRASRVSQEQIVQALRQAEAGTPVVEICPKLNVTWINDRMSCPGESVVAPSWLQCSCGGRLA